MDWTAIATGIISSGVIGSIIAYYFNKKQEDYKKELDKDLEKYKTKLKQETIRFSSQYRKRVEVIEEVYASLSKLRLVFIKNDWHLSNFRPEKIKTLRKLKHLVGDLASLHLENKIYLTDEQDELLNKIDSLSSKIIDGQYKKNQSGSRMDELFNALDTLMNLLEKDFKKTIGIEN